MGGHAVLHSVLTTAIALLVGLACLGGPGALAKRSVNAPCDLALVLAIDVSGSIDAHEYALQTEGLAAALRSPDVADALTAAGPGSVFISVLHWSGNAQQIEIAPWTRLSGRASIDELADRIVAFPRQFDKYSTAIGEALVFAQASFSRLPVNCRRNVIDVSGDGRSNEGWSPHLIRDQVVQSGTTINALAILAEQPDLFSYFRKHVIGGAGSFVISADRFEDYPEAIKKKLVREILPPLAQFKAPDHGDAVSGG